MRPGARALAAYAAAVIVSLALGFASPSPGAAGPKPNDDGSLSGITDIWYGNLGGGFMFFHCIALVDHDATTNDIKAALQCYSDIGLDDPQAGNYVDDIDGEGWDQNDDGFPDYDGAPPPPPYTLNPPAKAFGSLDPDGTANIAACFRNLGAVPGPNIIATLSAPNAKAQRADGIPDNLAVEIYYNQSDAACNALMPESAPVFYDAIAHALNVGEAIQSPWRAPGDLDVDNDGCTDAEELDKDGRPPGCGDDPWNPGDSLLSMSNVGGTYDVLVTRDAADRAPPVYDPANTEGPGDGPCNDSFDNDGDTMTDAADRDCRDPGAVISGSFRSCLASLQHNTVSNAVSARLFCYIDSASVTVNPEVSGQTSCPPAAAVFCGDGLAGGMPPLQPPPPNGAVETAAQCANTTDDDGDLVANDGCPGVYADVNTGHTELLGDLNSSTNVIHLAGCFKDIDGADAFGNVYMELDVDRYTGHGLATSWSNQSMDDCTGGTPAGASDASPIDIVRQNNRLGVQALAADSNDDRDSDGDGCSDRRELGDNQNAGGLRDPFNPWDYFESGANGQARVDDIIKVVNGFFTDYPNPAYSLHLDRVTILGGNDWNLTGPNFQMRVQDILAAVEQFFHDCGRNPRPHRIEG